MANKWVEFIKSWAKKNNKSYGCALSDPQLKIDYRKAYPSKQQQKERESSERETMGMEDRDALEEEVLIVEPTKKKRNKKSKLIQKLDEEMKKLEEEMKIIEEEMKKAEKSQIPVWTEPQEKKQKRKEKEKDTVMRALYKSITDLIYDNEMSLADALLTVFTDMQLTTQKLRSMPQHLENGKYTGKLLLYDADSLEKVDWFMEYVNKILRGNFDGINKKRYERYLYAYDRADKYEMFEMEKEDTRTRSKREYLKAPFENFYIGEEVKTYKEGEWIRAIVVRQTKSGMTLQPKEGGKTFSITNKRMDSSSASIEKIIK